MGSQTNTNDALSIESCVNLANVMTSGIIIGKESTGNKAPFPFERATIAANKVVVLANAMEPNKNPVNK